MLGLSPFRLYGAVAALLLLAGAIGYGVHIKHKADKYDEAQKTISSLRESIRKANEASEHYQARLTTLENERVTQPFPAIRMCRQPRVRPAASGSNAPSPEADEGTASVSPDIGPAADLYGTRCEAIRIQLEELQRFIRGRGE